MALARVEAESFSRVTISFYRYVILENVKELRDALYKDWVELGVLGRIYVAKEGINAQLSVPEHHVEKFRASVDRYASFKDVPFKIGVEENGISFWKLTIKARKYILADGLDFGEYDVTNVGAHLTAKDFNEALTDGATVVDMRNNYESDIGYFEGAMKADVTTFREQLPVVLEDLKGQEDKKILLYCTGGIRCEKTSAYLKHHGFKDVNQLHGGIIDYKHQLKREGLESKFKGANFVFDSRESEKITDEILGTCFQCKGPTNTHIDCNNTACHVMFLQCENCQEKMNRCCSDKCLTVSELPLEEQKKLRKGIKVVDNLVAR